MTAGHDSTILTTGARETSLQDFMSFAYHLVPMLPRESDTSFQNKHQHVSGTPEFWHMLSLEHVCLLKSCTPVYAVAQEEQVPVAAPMGDQTAAILLLHSGFPTPAQHTPVAQQAWDAANATPTAEGTSQRRSSPRARARTPATSLPQMPLLAAIHAQAPTNTPMSATSALASR